MVDYLEDNDVQSHHLRRVLTVDTNPSQPVGIEYNNILNLRCVAYHQLIQTPPNLTEVIVLHWKFIELLDEDNKTKSTFSVHPINEKRNVSNYICDLRKDAEKSELLPLSLSFLRML